MTETGTCRECGGPNLELVAGRLMQHLVQVVRGRKIVDGGRWCEGGGGLPVGHEREQLLSELEAERTHRVPEFKPALAPAPLSPAERQWMRRVDAGRVHQSRKGKAVLRHVGTSGANAVNVAVLNNLLDRGLIRLNPHGVYELTGSGVLASGTVVDSPMDDGVEERKVS